MGRKHIERIGMRKTNKFGMEMEVIDYIDANNIIVKFEDGSTKATAWRYFEDGSISSFPNEVFLREKRIGEENVNSQGLVMKIVEYPDSSNMVVRFTDPWYETVASYRTFRQGKIRNPLAPTVCGVGISGTEFPINDNCVEYREHRTWRGIIARCYSIKNGDSNYDDCTVSEEFLYYPNFYRWITSQENYLAWKANPRFAVDKDILCKGNRVYAPDKCCLVPSRINNLIKSKEHKNEQLPPGVQKKINGKYIAVCFDVYSKKSIGLGTYDNPHDAFLAYKKCKEAIIKVVAEREYANGMISTQCRDALLRYEIEETD